jgi:quercetin dioxygenase-like cupin family protein
MSTVLHENEVEPLALPGRTLRWLFTPERGGGKGFSMNVVRIAPGQTVQPAHSHPRHEEVIYIVSGTGCAYVDGKIHELREGTAVLFSPGAIHMLRNTGPEDLNVACFFTPQATLNDYVFHEDVRFPD